MIGRVEFDYCEGRHEVTGWVDDQYTPVDGGSFWLELDSLGKIYVHSTTWPGFGIVRSNKDSINDLIHMAMAAAARPGHFGLRYPLPPTPKIETVDFVKIDTAYYHNKRLEALAQLDTAGLDSFWRLFQKAIKDDRRKYVLDVLDYPMHEALIDEWHFSVDCDTDSYARRQDEYMDKDITPANAMARYDFLFTKELKAMIARTDLERILKEGHIGGTEAITYLFWAKHYGYGCGSDSALHFHFHRTSFGWRLAIATV